MTAPVRSRDRSGAWLVDGQAGYSSPLAHAVELAAVLDDPALHEFIGGSPLPAAALAERCARLESSHSPDRTQMDLGCWSSLV
jgi:hypothetical protein